MSTFFENIKKINEIFIKKIEFIKNETEFEELKKIFFGKNGEFENITEEFKKLSIDEKKKIGGFLQEIKKNCTDLFNQKKKNLFLNEIGFIADKNFDPFLNKGLVEKTKEHPYTESIKIINKFFSTLGFEIVDGPIVETGEYNFTALNIEENHPARDEMDTFWLKEKDFLLRTHTSAVQVKEAKKRNPPLGIISYGPVYRNEATDATHDFMFWQVEGLFISKDASISNLLFVFKNFFRSFFDNENLEIRIRPGFFPFVKPGMELDFECPFCESGCSVCKKTKWIEIGGTGMVHPNVMKSMNIIDPNIFGWAFGIGFTRLIMLKYDIKDIRLLHNSVFL